MRPDLTQRNAEIVRRYLAGETTPTIGRDYGIGACRVLQIATAAGAYRARITDFPHGGGCPPKPETTALRARVVALWNHGDTTQAQIASEQGLTRNVVGRLLWEARQAGQYVLTIGHDKTKERAAQGRRMAARMNESPTPGTPPD